MSIQANKNFLNANRYFVTCKFVFFSHSFYFVLKIYLHTYIIDLFRPSAPENGLIKVQGPLTVGKMLKFHCNPGFMMKGQPIMTCNEATDDGKYIGKWIGEVWIFRSHLIWDYLFDYNV